MKDKYFIDSNIFLYALSNKNPNKEKKAQKIILQNANISNQVINEVSSNLIKKLKCSESQVISFIDAAFARYKVISLSENIFVEASNLREKYFLSYYDSIIVSSALESNCNILYSEDMQNNQLINQQLRIINPF